MQHTLFAAVVVSALIGASFCLPIAFKEPELPERWIVLTNVPKGDIYSMTEIVTAHAVVYESDDRVSILARANEMQADLILVTYQGIGASAVEPSDFSSVFTVDCQNAADLALFAGRFPEVNAEFIYQSTRLGFVRVRGSVEKFSTFVPDACDIVVIPAEQIASHDSRSKTFVSPIRPIVKDDAIQDLVDGVSEAEQRVFLDQLTNNFNTRLAWAGDTIQATSFLVEKFKSLGFDVSTFSFRANYTDVVIAKIYGRVDPSRVVVVGAHYDDRSANINDPYVRAPGANDDGSGTAAIVEIARVIRQKSASFAYSVYICAFSGEEQGLYGSRAYAQSLKSNGVDVIAMFQSDMIAHRFPTNPLRMEMIERYSTTWLNEDVLNIASIYVPGLSLGYSSACCSDQQSFFEIGYPAVAVVEAGGYTVDPQYHRTGDVTNRSDFSFPQLRLITQVVLASTATYARLS